MTTTNDENATDGSSPTTLRAIGQNLGVLVVAVLIPLLWSALGLPWLAAAVVVGILVGTVALWRMNVQYRDIVDSPPSESEGEHWLRRHTTIAAGGAIVTALGAVALALASRANDRLYVGVAIALVLAGLIPVIQVIKVDAGEKDTLAFAQRRNHSLLAVVMNGGLALVALLPAALILAGPSLGSGLAAIIAALLWVVFVYARRRQAKATSRAGLVVVLLSGALFYIIDVATLRDLVLPGLGLVFGLVLLVGGGGATAMSLPSRAQSIFAPLGLLAGAVWLRFIIGGDVSRGFLLLAIAIPFVFGMSLVTKGEGLLVTAAFGVFVVWAAGDHTGEAQPLADPAADIVIGAFGDSYMAGEGIGAFYEDANTAWERDYAPGGVSGCRRSPDAYPELVRGTVAAETASTVSLDFRACSGAKSISNDGWETMDGSSSDGAVPDDREHNSLIGQFQRFADASAEPDTPEAADVDVVLLSLGGNDGGFSTIGRACFMPDSCGAAVEAIRDQDLARVSARVEVGLLEAAAAFPDTPLLVLSYPQMFGSETDDCGLPFSGDEVASLRLFVGGLNDAVAGAVDRVRSSGVDNLHHVTGVEDAFEGHRFCELDSDERAMNVLDLEPTEGRYVFDRLKPTVFIHNTFHPTADGHRLIEPIVANAVLAALDGGLDADAAGEEPAPTINSLLGADVTNPCTDIDHYVACVTIRLIKQLLVPLAFLVAAGAALAAIMREQRWMGALVSWGRDGARPAAVRWLFGVLPV